MGEARMKKTQKKVWTYLFVFTSVSAVLLLTGRCTFPVPEAPTWDVRFVVPLIDSTYTMSAVSDDSDNLNVRNWDGRTEIVFEFAQSTNTSIGPFLNVDMIENTTVLPLGDNDVNVSFRDSIVVFNAMAESGWLHITLDNTYDYNIRVTLTIEQLTLNNNPFTISRIVDANTPYDDILSLAGYRFSPAIEGDGSNTIVLNVVITDLSGITDNSHDADTFTSTFQIYDLTFVYVEGHLNRLPLDYLPREKEVDIPEEFEDFEIAMARVDINIYNELNLPGLLFFKVVGINQYNEKDSLMIENLLIRPGETSSYTNVDVAELINLHPQSVITSGQLMLGDGTFVTVQNTDSVTLDFDFSAPLIVRVPSQRNQSDIDTLDMDEDAREMIRDNLLEISLVTKARNFLPFGVDSLFLCFAKDTTAFFDPEQYTAGNPDRLRIGPLTLPPGETGNDPESVYQVVIAASEGDLSVALSKEDIRLFETEPVFYGVQFYFAGTDNQTARIRPTDYVYIQSYVSALIHTDFEDD